jgi:hypothetical protein
VGFLHCSMAKKRMSDDELKAHIADKLRSCLGSEDSQIAKDRQRNLEAYLADPTGVWAPPDIDDRSDLVATDVADTVEWMLPSLLRVFTASKDAIEAVPKRPQFEAQAQTVQGALRSLLWDKLDGVSLLGSWFKDALIQKVGFAKVGYEAGVLKTQSSYSGLTEGQVAMLAADDAVSIVSKTANEAEIEGQTVTLYDVQLESTVPDGRPTAHVVPPEEMRIDSAARYDDEPRFIGQVYERSRSALEALGYKVDGISAESSMSQEQNLRQSINSTHIGDDDDVDPMLECTEAYLRQGGENDASWERVFIVGDTLMDREKVEAHPYVWFCPAPMPHVFFGHCPADFAYQPQMLRTQLLRAVVDNVFLTVNGRTGVVESAGVNIDDVLNSRPGGLVRMKQPGGLEPIVQPDLTAAAWSAVEWAEQWTEKRTGFSRLSKGLSSESLNDTATGVLEITERADMRVELIARHAAVALGKLLRKLMHCMAKYQDVAQSVRINGQWVDVDPREWTNQYQVSVNVGMGTGNKDRQAAMLSQLQQVQERMAGAGLVPAPAVVALVRKLAGAMGVDQAETYFPDAPPPQPGQPPLPVLIEQMKGQQRMQEVQIGAQAKLQEVNANLQLQAANDQRDAERAQQQAAMDAQLQAMKTQAEEAAAVRSAELERYKAELQAQTQLQIAAMSQPAHMDLSGIQRMEQMVAQLMQAVTAPKRVVRDPQSGRVVGLEIAK